MVINAVVFVVLIASVGLALICMDNEDGIAVEHNCKTCKYCVIASRHGMSSRRIHLFGINQNEDSTEEYGNVLGLSEKIGPFAYNTLTTCLFEVYKNVANKRIKPEYIFRCMCNRDRCNNATDFDGFLTNMKY